MKNSKKTVTPSSRHWFLGALAFVGMGLAVGLKAASRLRKAAFARLRPRASKEDSDAITRMEGEGGPIVGLPQAHTEAEVPARG